MRLFSTHRAGDERLLWSRDSRFVRQLASALPGARMLELADSGWCVIAPATTLTEDVALNLAQDVNYGLVEVDASRPESERYLVALGKAVDDSRIADRIGMGRSEEIVKRKLLDYFFTLRNNHRVEFQPIVDLATDEPHEYECLFRPEMPMLPQSISGIVDAALTAKRPIDLDVFIVERILGRLPAIATRPDGQPRRFAINLLPASLLAPHFEAGPFAEQVRAVGLSPRQITLECTEQQAIADVVPLKRQVKALRRLGFGFAVDDAGAGYASFTLIASLEPSIIKIDRQIVQGVGNKQETAKKALVEAFVSFSRKIGARVVAEGIETRRDLAALRERGVDFGQGYLLGRSAPEPRPPRRLAPVRLAVPRLDAVATTRRVGV
ncbi:MAG TPA: EAL domain-containing protein [Candidatus Limnocylindrales bacterium]